ncbi:restriction endonuclease subunit S [Acinetobacter sichuanensis]|uniref:restriction endonuclease subunit S n=1 Tax=Acinetobacter sichuanensis TaxID=2136183 RepID=UPI00280E2CED|nr:restriction endonuclease subunit S [Acinetobacter sichuanensis]MDQ9020154.1 restriction endonuclease subunit S [Acinetobacter sichuanensis]
MYQKYDAYKDSGVQWLGDIPNDWKVLSLKHILNEPLKYGANEAGIEYAEDLPRYIRITDFNDNGELDDNNKLCLSWRVGKNYLLNDGDILLARSGASVGKSFLFKSKNVKEKFFCFAGYLIKAKVNVNLISSEYLYYYLNSAVFADWKNLIFNKATIENIGADKYANFPIILQSKKEQQKIVAFLDKKTTQIDQAIAIKEQQIALLNERKQIVIQQAVTKGLDQNVKMKDSGVEWIGEIPEHWEIFANRAIFSERNESGRDGLPLLSVSIHTGVSDEEMDEDTNVQGRVKIEDKSKYISVKKGDIAFNMMRAWQGAIGAVSVDGMVSPAYIVAKPTKRIDANFFEYQYRCPEFIQQMGRYSKGITDFRKRLYWDGFKQLSTLVPPISEQLKIIEFIKALNIQIETIVSVKTQQIQKLKEYKTTLINDAVTGKIKVA